MNKPRVAIVHYWLVKMRGGERVIERLLHLYPEADLFTHVYVPEEMSSIIRGRPVKTTFIQKLPGARKHYQKYLPLMPLALEELDLRGYDLVISSESGPAKGVITGPNTRHLCYCHSPMRYLWDHYHDYKSAAGGVARLAMPWMFHRLRQWDVSSATRVDQFIANSSFIEKRVRKVYRRDSIVVPPPVATHLFQPSPEVGDRYLWVGQMTPYKRADIALEAFNRLGLPLLMVGEGEMAADLAKRAKPNITIKPKLNFEELRAAYARSRALIFTAEEDFGIVPVEAMAAGRPVIAYGAGGVRDSVIENETGLFFNEQSADSLIEAVQRFETWAPSFSPQAAVRRAAYFAPERFDERFLAAAGEV